MHTQQFKIKSNLSAPTPTPTSEHVSPLTLLSVLLFLSHKAQSFWWLFKTGTVWLLCPLSLCLSFWVLQALSSAELALSTAGSQRALRCASRLACPTPGHSSGFSGDATSQGHLFSNSHQVPLLNAPKEPHASLFG